MYTCMCVCDLIFKKGHVSPQNRFNQEYTLNHSPFFHFVQRLESVKFWYLRRHLLSFIDTKLQDVDEIMVSRKSSTKWQNNKWMNVNIHSTKLFCGKVMHVIYNHTQSHVIHTKVIHWYHMTNQQFDCLLCDFACDNHSHDQPCDLRLLSSQRFHC